MALKWYQKKWGKILLIILLFILALVIVYLIMVASYLRQPRSAGQPTMVTADDPGFGSPEAKVQIVEFSDFECPFCKQAFPITRQIMNDYGDQIYFVYRDFPIHQVHPRAQKAAEAGQCAHEQGKFWPMHDKIFQNQASLAVSDLKRYAVQIGLNSGQFNNCLDSGKYQNEVQQDFTDGALAGVTGTPTFFINGQKVEGVIPESAFRKIINEILSQ